MSLTREIQAYEALCDKLEAEITRLNEQLKYASNEFYNAATVVQQHCTDSKELTTLKYQLFELARGMEQ